MFWIVYALFAIATAIVVVAPGTPRDEEFSAGEEMVAVLLWPLFVAYLVVSDFLVLVQKRDEGEQ